MGKKTTERQKETLISFMEKDPKFGRSGIASGPLGAEVAKKLWIELTNLLNSDNTGAIKDNKGWRETWAGFKKETKKKIGKMRYLPTNHSNLVEELSDFEMRVYCLCGGEDWVGLNSIPKYDALQIPQIDLIPLVVGIKPEPELTMKSVPSPPVEIKIETDSLSPSALSYTTSYPTATLPSSVPCHEEAGCSSTAFFDLDPVTEENELQEPELPKLPRVPKNRKLQAGGDRIDPVTEENELQEHVPKKRKHQANGDSSRSSLLAVMKASTEKYVEENQKLIAAAERNAVAIENLTAAVERNGHMIMEALKNIADAIKKNS